MTASDEREIMKKCIAAGVLPDILQREDITLEVKETTVLSLGQFLNTQTGEAGSFDEMKAAGGTDRKKAEIHREPPLFS
jgi:hypothetical protein